MSTVVHQRASLTLCISVRSVQRKRQGKDTGQDKQQQRACREKVECQTYLQTSAQPPANDLASVCIAPRPVTHLSQAPQHGSSAAAALTESHLVLAGAQVQVLSSQCLIHRRANIRLRTLAALSISLCSQVTIRVDNPRHSVRWLAGDLQHRASSTDRSSGRCASRCSAAEVASVNNKGTVGEGRVHGSKQAQRLELFSLQSLFMASIMACITLQVALTNRQ